MLVIDDWLSGRFNIGKKKRDKSQYDSIHVKIYI